MIREIEAQITKVFIRNPIEYDYNEPIFQIQVEPLREPWGAQLLFKNSQILDILNEFEVRFSHELLLKKCYLLDDTDKRISVPMGIKFHEDSEYIEIFNDFLH